MLGLGLVLKVQSIPPLLSASPDCSSGSEPSPCQSPELASENMSPDRGGEECMESHPTWLTSRTVFLLLQLDSSFMSLFL